VLSQIKPQAPIHSEKTVLLDGLYLKFYKCSNDFTLACRSKLIIEGSSNIFPEASEVGALRVED
jgi:hypothetical protein